MTIAIIHTCVVSKIIIWGYFWLLLVCRWAWEWWELGLTEGCVCDSRYRVVGSADNECGDSNYSYNIAGVKTKT